MLWLSMWAGRSGWTERCVCLPAAVVRQYGLCCHVLCAGIVAIDLARQMLQLYPDTYALVVSHENLTNNW